MFNIEIRTAIKKARLFNYEVAAAVGMTETAFSRKLSRQELSDEERSWILSAIERIAKEER